METLLKQVKTSPPTLIAGGATGIALLAYSIFSYYFRSQGELAPALDENETLSLMNNLLSKLAAVHGNMKGAHMNIKQQILSQGHQMSDREIYSTYILPHFEAAMEEEKNKVIKILKLIKICTLNQIL
jgi:hypothetical protein